jgi:Domain of unknown function (DUF4384)
MPEISRRTAIAAVVAAALGATRALAQTKDLQVEQNPSPTHPYYHHRRPARPAPAPYSGPVQVSLTPIGPSTLAIGEPIRFRMASLSDGYGHLYVLSASGRSQLWMENVRVHAGVPISFPRPGQTVRASPPAGDEVVLFVTTRSRIAGFLGGGSTSAMPLDLQFTHDAFRSALQSQLDALPREDWAVAELNIRVQE